MPPRLEPRRPEERLMAIELAHRYREISAKAYEHPADRAATSALHSVPLLDKVIKRLTDLGHERRLRQMVMGNAVRIGAEQMPDLWRDYVSCSSVLDLPATPDLYVTNDPVVNAMTIGAKTPIVIVRSSLVGAYDADETKTVLGHELGHVLSEHYYYTTALVLLKQFMEGALPKSPLLGLPVRGLVRIAGGALPGMSLDAFIKQAAEYDSEDDLFSRHSRFWVELSLTHPIAVRRVKEMIEWVQSGEYDRIVDGNYPRRGQEPPPSVEFD